MLSVIGLLIGVFLCAVMMTGVMRRYALAREMLDVPNARSSHVVATPRGGGAAIVVAFLLGVVLVWVSGGVDKKLALAVIGAGALVAGIGLWDDHGHVSQQWRLLVHFTAACWALYWLGGAPPLQFPGFSLQPGWLGLGVAAVFLVWLLNLFNFMDGIDGIAGSEAVFIAVGGALLAWSAGSEGLALVLSVLAAATLGFLLWNLPPAKIFMGDVGSGFLGVVLGVLAYTGAVEGMVSLWVWLILFAVFLVDATITLLRRMLRGDKWYEAHRSHAYQWAARSHGHARVTIAVNLINIFWLFPLALCAFVKPEWGVVIIIVAYVPLVVGAVVLGAGSSE